MNCSACGETMDEAKHGWIRFNFLKDEPIICERCVFEVLMCRVPGYARPRPKWRFE